MSCSVWYKLAVGFLIACGTAMAQQPVITTSESQVCTTEVQAQCCLACPLTEGSSHLYNCSIPGLDHLSAGMYEGITANYLSFATDISSIMMSIRAKEFQECTGGRILFSEARNVWEDPVRDIGTKTSRGSELYDGYFMSYSHFPEVSALGLAETLNERIRKDSSRLQWEDILPAVKTMGEYRKNGTTNIDFLMYDGDFFVPLIRVDLLEQHNLPLPNTWDEVVEYAKFFNGRDLNDDGIPDYGFCHFPRVGAGHWDWWFAEIVYATWATYSQTQGIKEGFFFDPKTMQPKLGEGFRKSVEIWKDLWSNGNSTSAFVDGRCAIGFGPPGAWKGVFLDPAGVSRKDEGGNVVWQATLKNGDYAEPYRFKPFGSLQVEDPDSGKLVDCTPTLCPKGEPVPHSGHFAGDRLSSEIDLPPSPHQGKLINRSPFYWSGGLGTLIRKSSPEDKKDLLWDFFVYTNSPDTSVHDVANYQSWLDSWRYSQLSPGQNFLDAGWSKAAYQEHSATMQWALSDEVNGSLNLRLPGVLQYTRDVVGGLMEQYIAGSITLTEVINGVDEGWEEVTEAQGLLGQLEIYRSSLRLDSLSGVDLCRIHRALMDAEDPSLCRVYDTSSQTTVILAATVTLSIILVLFLVSFVYFTRSVKHSAPLPWHISKKELRFVDPPEVLGRGTFGMVVLAE